MEKQFKLEIQEYSPHDPTRVGVDQYQIRLFYVKSHTIHVSNL